MQAVYGGDQCVDVSTVSQWVRQFKDGELAASGFEWQNTKLEGLWLQVISFIKMALEDFADLAIFVGKNNYAALKIIDVGIFIFYLFN